MHRTRPDLKRRKKEKLKKKRALYEAKFESVKRWTSGVDADYSGSSKTKEAHLNYLIKFCENVGMNPDEIINTRIQDSMSCDPRVRNRFEYLVKGFVGKLKNENGYSVAHHAATSLKSFFFYSNVPLTYKAPRIKDPETYTPTTEALEKLYQLANPGWERFRISFIRACGARRGTVARAKYRHIKKDFEAGIIPLHIHFDNVDVKGHYFGYDTFLGRQAVEDLRLSLEQRKRGTRKIPPEVIRDESPLLRKENTAVVEPCDETGLTSWFVSLSRRVGFEEEETITPHGVRRSTETALEDSKLIPQNWIDHIMGHRPRGAQGKHYSKPTVEQLRAAYAKAESYLTLRLTPPGDVLVTPADVAAGLKTANETTNGQISKSERIATKPLDKLTEQEIKRLHEKRQQVQQSLGPYLKPSSIQTQPLKTEENFLNDDKQDKTLASEKTVKAPDLHNSSKAETCPCAKEQESVPYQVIAVTAKDDMIRRLEEGWDFIKRLADGTVLLGRIPSETIH